MAVGDLMGLTLSTLPSKTAKRPVERMAMHGVDHDTTKRVASAEGAKYPKGYYGRRKKKALKGLLDDYSKQRDIDPSEEADERVNTVRSKMRSLGMLGMDE